jgi:hypothetical protein
MAEMSKITRQFKMPPSFKDPVVPALKTKATGLYLLQLRLRHSRAQSARKTKLVITVESVDGTDRFFKPIRVARH